MARERGGRGAEPGQAESSTSEMPRERGQNTSPKAAGKQGPRDMGTTGGSKAAGPARERGCARKASFHRHSKRRAPFPLTDCPTIANCPLLAERSLLPVKKGPLARGAVPQNRKLRAKA